MQIAMVSMHTSPADRPGTGDAGGMNVVVLELAKALADRGHRVDLFTRSPGAADTRTLHPGVVLYALETGGGIVRKHELANLADEFGERFQQAALRASLPYDVIHAHYWLSGLAALPVSLALGVPLVQSFHTLAVERNRRLAEGEHPEPERRVLTERYLAHEADALVSVSAAEAEVLIDELDASPDRVWLVSPGVDTVQFAPGSLRDREQVRDRLGVADGEELLVVVGRVQPAKGQDLAVELLAQLPGAVLAIVGEPPPGDQPFVEQLHARAGQLGVADRLRRVGSLDRSSLSRLLAAASLVVVPSRTEAFGIVPLEAAACGTPVVAARVGGLAESVCDGRTGVLVDSRDPAVWAAACAALLDDPMASAAMAADARRHAGARTWAHRAAAMERVYENLGRGDTDPGSR